MNRLLGAAAICAAIAISPMSAQANCNGGRFAGPYIGLAAGFGSHAAKQTSVNEPDASDRDTSFTGGGYAGYNVQCSNIVIGIEGDINYLGSEANSSFPDPIFMKSKIDWFGTVRGRAGILVRDDTLLYGTAGVAFASVSRNLSDPNPPVGPAPFTQTDKDREAGLVLGGGIEFLHYDRWLVRAEALYVDLGKTSHEYTIAACGVACTGRADWHDSFWVGRIGISLKLGHEEQHVPMK